MPTKNNVFQLNLAKGTGDRDVWNQIYLLTRAMKKAGWKHLASGDGSSKSVDPTNDLFGNGVTTGNSGAAASITAVSGGRATVTGLTGITTESKGRFLTISGSGSGNNGTHQIEEIIDATSVRIDARTTTITAPDANNGSLGWVEVTPLSDTNPLGTGVAGWWLAYGPSVLKLPITSRPVVGPSTTIGFVRGENVVQASTGAEAEFLGYVFDDDNSIGFAVLAPRVRGTGGDPFGWGTGNTITGDISAATMVQDGTVEQYQQQVVIAKTTNDNQGRIFVQCIDPVGETANDFATLAATAGATSVIPPGGGGTGNAFPSIAYVACGTDISSAEWCGSSVAILRKGQVVAIDAIEEQYYSADGTWHWVVNSTDAGGIGEHLGRNFLRMDDIEPGELDPYVSFGLKTGTLYNNDRVSAPASASTSLEKIYSVNIMTSTLTTSNRVLQGWRRRGLGTNDTYQDFEFSLDRVLLKTSSGSDRDVPVVLNNTPSPDKVITEDRINRLVRVREPAKVVSVQTGFKIRKGSCRWLYYTLGGYGGQTFDSGKYILLSSDTGIIVLGPWDETTLPDVL